jgi:ribonuclease BN (tRNA processing enzyme)
VLVEPSPTVLPHLRRCGIRVESLDAVLISHFHADHTFGWPFLLLELLRHRGDSPLSIVGPPEVEAFLADMTILAGVPDILEAARQGLQLRYVEVDGAWQTAGPVRFRAVEVEHVPHLRCFGYLLEREGRTIGYSGDTRPCAGLDELASAADVLVLECNGRHPWPTHMDAEAVRDLRRRFPDTRYVLTHLGDDVVPAEMGGFTVPDDFETLEV